MEMPPLPEHEKLAAAKKTDDATQLIVEFIQHLAEKGSILGHYVTTHKKAGFARGYAEEVWTNARASAAENREGLVAAAEAFRAEMHFDPEDLYDDKCWVDHFTPLRTHPRDLLADFFGLDLNKLEGEKRALLDYERSRHAKDAAT